MRSSNYPSILGDHVHACGSRRWRIEKIQANACGRRYSARRHILMIGTGRDASEEDRFGLREVAIEEKDVKGAGIRDLFEECT